MKKKLKRDGEGRAGKESTASETAFWGQKAG